jgi:hypothetical protein
VLPPLDLFIKHSSGYFYHTCGSISTCRQGFQQPSQPELPSEHCCGASMLASCSTCRHAHFLTVVRSSKLYINRAKKGNRQHTKTPNLPFLQLSTGTTWGSSPPSELVSVLANHLGLSGIWRGWSPAGAVAPGRRRWAPVLARLSSAMFQLQRTPCQFTLGRTTPRHEGDSMCQASNYRPITLLNSEGAGPRGC